MKSLWLVVTFLALFPAIAQGQKKSESVCSLLVKYENQNQVEPDRLVLGTVSGIVMFQSGNRSDKVFDVAPVPWACVALFSEENHRLLFSEEADSKGYFRFGKVKRGTYRLLVRDKDNLMCVANVPIRVVRGGKTQSRSPIQMTIHMRNSGIDDCSYGDYK